MPNENGVFVWPEQRPWNQLLREKNENSVFVFDLLGPAEPAPSDARRTRGGRNGEGRERPAATEGWSEAAAGARLKSRRLGPGWAALTVRRVSTGPARIVVGRTLKRPRGFWRAASPHTPAPVHTGELCPNWSRYSLAGPKHASRRERLRVYSPVPFSLAAGCANPAVARPPVRSTHGNAQPRAQVSGQASSWHCC